MPHLVVELLAGKYDVDGDGVAPLGDAARGEQPAVFRMAPDSDSSYKELRVKDRRIFASTLYSLTLGDEERLTPEQVALEYSLPVEAVYEAIAYCQSNPPEISDDLALDEARAQARGMNTPDYKYNPASPYRSPESRSPAARS